MILECECNKLALKLSTGCNIYSAGSFRSLILLVFIAVVAMGVFLSSYNLALGPNQAYASTEFKTYTNEDYNFTIDYPSDWTIRESGLGPYEAVMFVSESDEPAVVKVALGFVSAATENMSIYEFDEEIVNIGKTSETKLITKSNTTLAGLPAIQYVYYQYGLGSSFKVLETSAISDENELIAILYTTDPEYYDTHIPIVEHMTRSFKIGLE